MFCTSLKTVALEGGAGRAEVEEVAGEAGAVPVVEVDPVLAVPPLLDAAAFEELEEDVLLVAACVNALGDVFPPHAIRSEIDAASPAETRERLT
ncbi:MAG: hypothetical protein ACRD3E_14045 [Terriglobales bacterium]